VLGLDPGYVRLGLKRWRQHCLPTSEETQRQRGMPAQQPFPIAA
jgi:hypothetical protein